MKPWPSWNGHSEAGPRSVLCGILSDNLSSKQYAVKARKLGNSTGKGIFHSCECVILLSVAQCYLRVEYCSGNCSEHGSSEASELVYFVMLSYYVNAGRHYRLSLFLLNQIVYSASVFQQSPKICTEMSPLIFCKIFGF